MSTEPRRDALPPDTASLWKALEREPLLAGFSLVGGTAIAMRIGHRLSEDLDFACDTEKLPVHRIDRLVRKLEQEGFHIQRVPNVAAEQDFLNDGLDLLDYQRDYAVGHVKLSLFCPDPELRAVLSSLPKSQSGPVVPDLDRLFASKALVCAHRSKTRDWLDLYVLCIDHGYRLKDVHQVFEKYDKYGWDSGIHRLTTMHVPPDDEGYRHMMANPPSLDAMRDYFIKERASLEAGLARMAIQRDAQEIARPEEPDDDLHCDPWDLGR